MLPAQYLALSDQIDILAANLCMNKVEQRVPTVKYLYAHGNIWRYQNSLQVCICFSFVLQNVTIILPVLFLGDAINKSHCSQRRINA